MYANEMEQRLSQISTLWTVMRAAHRGEADAAATARQELMQRYSGAVYRYLLSAVGDPHATEDLTQEFALRFISGRFHNAAPERGRFRDYVKTALFNLVKDYRQNQARAPQTVSYGAGEEPAIGFDESAEADRKFAESWREELLSRTWKSLEEHEAASGQPYYTVLRCRVENADLPSAKLAELLSARMGKALTPAGVRQLLHRSREQFVRLLVEETRRSLGTAADQVQDELADLNLLKYCEGVL